MLVAWREFRETENQSVVAYYEQIRHVFAEYMKKPSMHVKTNGKN